MIHDDSEFLITFKLISGQCSGFLMFTGGIERGIDLIG